MSTAHGAGGVGLTNPVRWLATASSAWAGVLLLSPLLPASLAVVAYALGGVVCHQLTERSFHVSGHQLAVCARCTGIYVGAAIALVWQAFVYDANRRNRHASIGVVQARLWLLLGAVPTLVTVTMEMGGLWATSNTERAVAGLPLGASVAIVVGVSSTVNYEQWRQRRHE